MNAIWMGIAAAVAVAVVAGVVLNLL